MGRGRGAGAGRTVEHEVERDRGCPEVGLLSGEGAWLAALGRHERRRPRALGDGVIAVLLDVVAHAKVRELEHTGLVHQQILRLDVAARRRAHAQDQPPQEWLRVARAGRGRGDSGAPAQHAVTAQIGVSGVGLRMRGVDFWGWGGDFWGWGSG